MKIFFLFLGLNLLTAVYSEAQNRFITRSGQATLFSHTVAEDIQAENNTVTGVIDPGSGEILVSVPVQSFRFEKALMQEHFNSSRFMDSKKFPRISFKGKISNPEKIDLSKNGHYELTVSGMLTIRGISKEITAPAVIEVKDGRLYASSNFVVQDISAYGVGKPSGSKKHNVADDIRISYKASYEQG